MILAVLSSILMVNSVFGCHRCHSITFKCPYGDKLKVCPKRKAIGCVVESASVGSEASHRCKLPIDCDRNQWYSRIDGCSVPSSIDFTKYMRTVFKPACNVHDLCYHAPGTGWRNCNNRFYANMLTICKHRVDVGTCSTIASTVATGVSVHWAYDAYKKDQQWANTNMCDNAYDGIFNISNNPFINWDYGTNYTNVTGYETTVNYESTIVTDDTDNIHQATSFWTEHWILIVSLVCFVLLFAFAVIIIRTRCYKCNYYKPSKLSINLNLLNIRNHSKCNRNTGIYGYNINQA